MKPKQLARLKELRILIDAYFKAKESEKQERLRETNPVNAPIIRTAPVNPTVVAAALESIAATGQPPKAGKKKFTSVPVASSS